MMDNLVHLIKNYFFLEIYYYYLLINFIDIEIKKYVGRKK